MKKLSAALIALALLLPSAAYAEALSGHYLRRYESSLKNLKNKDNRTRSHGARRLGSLPRNKVKMSKAQRTTAIEALIKRLNEDDDDSVKAAAAWALGIFKAEEAVDTLYGKMNDRQHRHAAFASIYALASFKNKHQKRFLQFFYNGLKNGGDYPSQVEAVKASVSIVNDRTFHALLRILKTSRSHGIIAETARSLREFKDTRAVQPLIKCLKPTSDCVRWLRRSAISTLGKIATKDPAAAKALITALKDDDDENNRIQAIIALGSLKATAAVPLLLKRINDKNQDIAREAIRALGEIKARAAVAPLIGKIKDDKRSIRKMAIKALGNIGDRAAIPPILDAMEHDKFIPARVDAATAIARIGDKSAADPLKSRLAKEKNEWVNGVIRSALLVLEGDKKLLPDDWCYGQMRPTAASQTKVTAKPPTKKPPKDDDEETDPGRRPPVDPF